MVCAGGFGGGVRRQRSGLALGSSGTSEVHRSPDDFRRWRVALADRKPLKGAPQNGSEGLNGSRLRVLGVSCLDTIHVVAAEPSEHRELALGDVRQFARKAQSVSDHV